MGKVKVSITLDEEVVEEVKHLADNDDRSFSQFVNKVLKRYVQSVRSRTQKQTDKETDREA